MKVGEVLRVRQKKALSEQDKKALKKYYNQFPTAIEKANTSMESKGNGLEEDRKSSNISIHTDDKHNKINQKRIKQTKLYELTAHQSRLQKENEQFIKVKKTQWESVKQKVDGALKNEPKSKEKVQGNEPDTT